MRMKKPYTDNSYKIVLRWVFSIYFTQYDLIVRHYVNRVKEWLYAWCHVLHFRDSHMGDGDWKTFGKLPTELIEMIDDYINSSHAKKMGINSRSDFMIRLVTAFFSNYMEEFRLFMPKDLAE